MMHRSARSTSSESKIVRPVAVPNICRTSTAGTLGRSTERGGHSSASGAGTPGTDGHAGNPRVTSTHTIPTNAIEVPLTLITLFSGQRCPSAAGGAGRLHGLVRPHVLLEERD